MAEIAGSRKARKPEKRRCFSRRFQALVGAVCERERLRGAI